MTSVFCLCVIFDLLSIILALFYLYWFWEFQHCLPSSCFDQVFLVTFLHQSCVCPLPPFDVCPFCESQIQKRCNGRDSGVKAVLMFNSSVCPNSWMIPLLLLASPSVAGLVFSARDELKPVGNTEKWRREATAGWGGLFTQLPHQCYKQPISHDTQVSSLFDYSNMRHMLIQRHLGLHS